MVGYACFSCRLTVQPLVCEFSDKNLRSLTATFGLVGYSVGYAVTMTLGAIFAQWRFISLGFVPLMIILMIGLSFIHESPYWLLKQDRVQEASVAWAFYNPSTEDDKEELQNEFMELQKSAREAVQKERTVDKEYSRASQGKSSRSNHLSKFHSSTKQSFARRITTQIRLLKRPDVYKPLTFLTISYILFELSSFTFIGFYVIVLFEVSFSYCLNFFV